MNASYNIQRQSTLFAPPLSFQHSNRTTGSYSRPRTTRYALAPRFPKANRARDAGLHTKTHNPASFFLSFETSH